MKRLWIMTAAALLISLLCCGCAPAEKLTVVLVAEGLPLAAADTAGDSFYGELAQLLAAELKRPLALQVLSREACVAALAAGKADAAIGIRANDAGADALALSGPFMMVRQVAVVPQSANIGRVTQLKGTRVVVGESSVSAGLLSAQPELRRLFSSVVYTKDIYNALLDVVVSDYSAALVSEPTACWYIQAGSLDLQIASEGLDGDGVGLYIALPGNGDNGVIEAAYGALEEKGTLESLHSKWFGRTLLPDQI